MARPWWPLFPGCRQAWSLIRTFIDRELWRRQQGFGRGGRMKIETDKAHFLSGVRHSKTIGSPIAVILQNRDWQNWKESFPSRPVIRQNTSVSHLRGPGHADLAGALEIRFHRSAICAGACLGPRIGRPRRDWGARQVIFAGVGNGSLESCDCGGRGLHCRSRNPMGAD